MFTLSPEQLLGVDQIDKVTISSSFSLDFFSEPDPEKSKSKEKFINSFGKAVSAEFGKKWAPVLLEVLNQTEWARKIIPVPKETAVKNEDIAELQDAEQ